MLSRILGSLRKFMGARFRSGAWESSLWPDAGSSSGELRKPYAHSAWVHSAVSLVAGTVAARPLVFSEDGRGGDAKISDPTLDAFWEAPGRNGGGSIRKTDFIEATAGLLKLRGQAFWLMDDSWDAGVRALRSPLILARPGDMHAIQEGGMLVGWVWTGATGRKHTLVPDQVVHLKLWNPDNDILGLSDWESAMLAAESDYAAGTFARNLSANNGDRGPFVIGKGGMFSDEQIAQVTAQLRMKREMGRRGEFRAAFLPADVEVVDPKLAATDGAFAAQRLENRKEIYAAFGVPPSFADPQSSYSIGSASDMFRLIELTCAPLGEKIADAIELVSRRLLPGRTIFAALDWDTHSTMAQVRTERFATACQGVDRGMPWRTASEYFGLRLPRFTGDDVGRVPYSLQEVSATPDEPEADTVGQPPATYDPVAEMQRLFAARALGRAASAPPPKDDPRWVAARRKREPWERKLKSRISRLLMDARAETLRNIAAAAETKAPWGMDALSLAFDLGDFLTEWVDSLGGIAQAAMEKAGLEAWTEELLRDDPLTMPAAETLTALQQRKNMLSGAGEKIHRAVMDTLQAGIEAGETHDQLAERVRVAFRGIGKDRAAMIAKTETTVAYETARHMAFQAAGVQWKQWLCSGLENSRTTHLAAHEQIRELNEPFDIGGYAMLYPGDPAGPAKETINCMCVSIAVAGPDQTDIEGNDGFGIPY